MPRTTAGLRTEDRLSAAIDPSWRKWEELVALAVEESQQPAWSGTIHLRDTRAADAPLLHHASVSVDSSRAAMLIGRIADQLGIVGLSVDPMAVILAGIEREADTLDLLAQRLAVNADLTALLSQLSALPLLLNAAKLLTPEISRTWQRGYCPVCGAWPSMVEMRGIQRERRLRCGCCGSDWILPVLHCAFCDETDHQKLGSLVSDGADPQTRVETCTTCHGYLKSVTTLSLLPFTALAMKDMATLAFDIAAQDRGFARPARPGWQLEVEIVQ